MSEPRGKAQLLTDVTLENLVLLLTAGFLTIVGIGCLALRIVGFSFGKGVLITTTFLFLGFWNPIGWIVLGLCIWLQMKENRERLLAAQLRPQVPPAGATRVEAGPVTAEGSSRRPMLRRGDRC